MSWCTQKSPGRKPDPLAEQLLLVSIKLKDDLNIDFSNNFLHIGDKDISGRDTNRQLSNIKVSVLYSEGYWYIILALLQIFNPVHEVYLGQDIFDHLKNNFWGNAEGKQPVINQLMQSRTKCTVLLIVVHWLVKQWCYRPRRITKLFSQS